FEIRLPHLLKPLAATPMCLSLLTATPPAQAYLLRPSRDSETSHQMMLYSFAHVLQRSSLWRHPWSRPCNQLHGQRMLMVPSGTTAHLKQPGLATCQMTQTQMRSRPSRSSCPLTQTWFHQPWLWSTQLTHYVVKVLTGPVTSLMPA